MDVWGLKTEESPKVNGVPVWVPEDETSEDDLVSGERPIRCRACGHPVTTVQARILVNGSHTHAFANPHGYLFEIGCYQRAAGGRAVGRRSMEFSWFPGYGWEILVCMRCGFHLGWRFAASAHVFYGLILDALAF